ncbi:MAG TPA: bifunctional adenosylcobinamide kinase/adenosylcobinamide-phosphate guanylyltransferase [Clostridiales bacterium]|nr:bifunctional adenosylcobinamide kinase/adenosylcobinamide-phosphate guanylyltransferase [Clostridiales bacterium]
MVALIIGGSGSGKSEYAENRIVQQGKEDGSNLLYIATMQPFGEETLRKIQRHQSMRQNKGFLTMERYVGLEQVTLPENTSVLLECMSNLVANEMFSASGAKEHTEEAILEGIEKLMGQAKNLFIVTNNVFEDGGNYDPTTGEYLKVLGNINRRISRQSDQVIEVVHGIPVMVSEKQVEIKSK